jgi:hypothetical protein
MFKDTRTFFAFRYTHIMREYMQMHRNSLVPLPRNKELQKTDCRIIMHSTIGCAPLSLSFSIYLFFFVSFMKEKGL